jgi:hypothetical protein
LPNAFAFKPCGDKVGSDGSFPPISALSGVSAASALRRVNVVLLDGEVFHLPH